MKYLVLIISILAANLLYSQALEKVISNGYIFADEGYVKLKILAYLVHKDAVPELTEK